MYGWNCRANIWRTFGLELRLNQVMAIFKAPLKRDAPPQSVLLEHYFSTSLSKCYRASAGKLNCVTCHDPHDQPATEEAPAYYRGKCLNCHQPASCTLAIEARRKTSPPDNCTACHMPKRTVTTITHAALTDHRIAARPDEPYPDSAFGPTDAASGLLLLTGGAGGANGDVPPITLFQAYASLLKDGHAEFKAKAEELLNRLARDSASDPRVLSALARRWMSTHSQQGDQEAIQYFRRAFQMGWSAREDYLLLAELYSSSGQYDSAAAILKQAFRENPYTREFPDALAALYVRRGEYRTALETIRKALEVFPDDITLRGLQKKVQSATLDGSISP